ncbi:MAG TPA: MerR family transcriptional regulator [Nitrospirae bacterium]|nr:MerR family transcriptional regulator [Nitrospirota bacterium]HDO34675.1 MerR family transcriptional regulator [Nitrospirota bacterium]HDZ87957.1 MerR family transcriptional regulator [Nitrospirota bacterium]
MNNRDRSEPLYMISVVSRMLGVHPQTLRLYEREGLICPKRNNRQRLYSEEDIERINFILQLTRELGVNKAGVDIILRMREKLELMHREMDDMMTRLEDDVRAEFERKLRKLFSS